MLKKILIVGAGSIGSRYFKILRRKKSLLVKRYDIDKKKSDFLKFQDSLSWLPEYVIICSPNNLHLKILNKIINTIKLKRILVEKPLGTNLREIINIENNKNFKKNKKKILISCNMRFHPAIKKIKKYIESKKQKIHYSEIFWHYKLDGKNKQKNYFKIKSQGGGIIFDLWHEIDLVTYFFGKINKAKVHNYYNKKKINKLSKITIKHNSGIMSFVSGDYLRSLKERGMKIIFENSTLDWISIGKYPEKIQINLLKNNIVKNIFKSKLAPQSQSVMYEIMLDNFLNKKKHKMLDWDQSKKILKLISNV